MDTRQLELSPSLLSSLGVPEHVGRGNATIMRTNRTESLFDVLTKLRTDNTELRQPCPRDAGPPFHPRRLAAGAASVGYPLGAGAASVGPAGSVGVRCMHSVHPETVTLCALCQSPRPLAPGQWKCGACTYVNTAPACEMCEAARPAEPPAQERQPLAPWQGAAVGQKTNI